MWHKSDVKADNRIIYEALSNEDLVSCCIMNDREAKNEFCRRFLSLIKGVTKGTLIYAGQFKLSADIDIIAEIQNTVLMDLFQKNLLKDCQYPNNIRSWLEKVTANHTISWLRSRGRTKNLPEVTIEGTTLSLDTPLNDYDDLSIIDTLKDETSVVPVVQELEQELKEVISRMNEMDNMKAFWALRLSIIAYEPLSEEETHDLFNFNGMPEDKGKEKLGNMMKTIEKKFMRKIKAESRAVVLWYEILKLEAKAKEKYIPDNELLQKIYQKRKIRMNHIREAQIICRPSNEQIAGMIGLPADQVHQITNILKRARQKLKEST